MAVPQKAYGGGDDYFCCVGDYDLGGVEARDGVLYITLSRGACSESAVFVGDHAAGFDRRFSGDDSGGGVSYFIYVQESGFVSFYVVLESADGRVGRGSVFDIEHMAGNMDRERHFYRCFVVFEMRGSGRVGRGKYFFISGGEKAFV